MLNELFTTPCSPVFAGITVGFIGFIKPTQQILKQIGKGTGDNLTVRIEMECRHQVTNVAKVHSLNQCSKCKGVYYGYSYGYLHVVGMLTGMTTTIINGARGIGINAGHRTST